ncbi:MAG: transcriptional regulator [Pseudomonadota bacterium]
MVAKSNQARTGESKSVKSESKSELKTNQKVKSLRAITGFVHDEAGDYQKLLNDRVRLGILSSLAVSPKLTFRDLRDLLAVTDGNLSTHARKLEQARYIQCAKSFADRVPRTEYRITPAGRSALKRYLKHMQALIQVTTKT